MFLRDIIVLSLQSSGYAGRGVYGSMIFLKKHFDVRVRRIAQLPNVIVKFIYDNVP